MRNQIKIDIMRFCKFHWSNDETLQEMYINAIYQQVRDFKPAITPNSHLSHNFILNRCQELNIKIPTKSPSTPSKRLSTTSLWRSDTLNDLDNKTEQESDSKSDPEINALKKRIKYLENQLKIAQEKSSATENDSHIEISSNYKSPSCSTKMNKMTISRNTESLSPTSSKSCSNSSSDLPIQLHTNNSIHKSDHKTIESEHDTSSSVSIPSSKSSTASLDIPNLQPLPFSLHLQKVNSSPKPNLIENEATVPTSNAKVSLKVNMLTVEPGKFSGAQRRAWNRRVKNPNEFYYRFSAKIIYEDDEKQKKVCIKPISGPWTDEEHILFMKRVRSLGVNGHWGVFSMAIPTRVGYSCSQYWQKLIKLGHVQDMNFCEVRNTGKQYPFMWKWKNTSRKDIQELEDAKHFSFIVIKDHSGVWKNLPANHPRHPGHAGFKEIEQKYKDYWCQNYIKHMKKVQSQHNEISSPSRKRRRVSAC